LARVILHCMQKEPEQRPQTAADVGALLRASLGA
jgi:hypothetical protein